MKPHLCDAHVLAAKHLVDVVHDFTLGLRPQDDREAASTLPQAGCVRVEANKTFEPVDYEVDFSDVRGQAAAKRALKIAAAGRHSLLFVGPPGTGKSMLAQRLPSILPELGITDALETAAIASVDGHLNLQHWRLRPFRSPHHTCSAVALVGGSCSFQL